MKKIFVKDFIFTIIFIVLLIICSHIFVLKGNTYGSDIISFYNQKRNSLDIVFLGSSHSYATFSPQIIEREIGLKSYNFATQQQPINITYHYMVETLKTQKPKYFVLEIRMLAVDEDYATEGVVRDAVDKMKFSINKIKTIQSSVENQNDRMSYYFNIIKYHSRYNDLDLADFKTGLTQIGIKNLGYKNLEENFEIEIDNSAILKIKDTEKISSKNAKYLEKMVELANKNDIKLILVKSPCKVTEEAQKKYNYVEEYALKNKLEYIDYNKLFKELDLQKGDFFDEGHLSGSGAEKVSISFAKYLN